MNPLFTSGICDNLFTKHSTLMAYISKPLVRTFHARQYIVDIVNKTSHDKGGACANEKRKRCNRILP